MKERVNLTPEQRDSIRERDMYECQFPYPHECSGNFKASVHHITPYAYACRALRWSLDQINSGENLLFICSEANKLVHPTSEHNSYFDVESMWDLSQVAKSRTRMMTKKGWKFPQVVELMGVA